jgi:L-rhamnose isomerase
VESSDGYLLTGYQADYDEPGKPETKTQLQARLEHQTIDGIQIPKVLNLAGTYGTTPFVTEATFADCTVTTR